ncbi:MAG: primosomal protein N' [Phycisphaerales bacterium]|nr:primosomal protein N' [Phycisphaerales bacterium]
MDLFPHQPVTPTQISSISDPNDSVFVRVALERGIDRAQGFTYRTNTDAQVGQRVSVPVGRGNVPTGGIIIECGDESLLDGFDPAKVKSVISQSPAILPSSLVELAQWMSEYYMCPLGMVFSSIIPSAVKSDTGRKIRKVVDRSPVTPTDEQIKELTPKAREAWKLIAGLEPTIFPLDPKVLASKIGQRTVAAINKLINAGLMIRAEVQVIKAPKVFELLDAGESGTHTLSDDQASAVDGITKSLGTFAPHLLFGVTGSGKTEVYIKLIEQVLAAGKQAIVLVPEIALTPQTAGRFVKCFESDGVAILHSGLTRSARNQQWAAAASGEAKVVVGARSAVFAPFSNTGVIIVDEEHDSSYKQDQLPRYNARDAAVKRAQIENCPIVLGSATPSLESWANAKAKRYSLWTMPNRVGQGNMPKVQIVNMAGDNEELRPPKQPGFTNAYSIGRTLGAELISTIENGNQAILLLNRRGFAAVVVSSDRSSGWRLECNQCDSTMVVHRGSVREQGGRRYVKCHHCQSEQLIPKQCPMTGKPLIELGVGTQRVEEEIQERFGERLGLILDETYTRVDADTMKNSKDYFNVLDRFGKGELKLLLGTQMISKGLDFPNVSLVGVLNADTSLYLPDFRAEERTYQLVSQVAGRSGRGIKPGKVIVQTLNPGSAAITRAAKHDYIGFANDELQTRRVANLPPIVRMVRIVIRDEDNNAAHQRAYSISEQLRSSCGDHVSIVGPMPCSISRIANRYRWAIELGCRSPKPMQDAMMKLRTQGLLTSDSKVAIDVDPIWLM